MATSPTDDRLDFRAELRDSNARLPDSYARLRDGLLGWMSGIAPEDATPKNLALALRVIRDLARTQAAIDGRGSIGNVTLAEVKRAFLDTAYIADLRKRIDFTAKLIAARAGQREATRKLRSCRADLARAQARDQRDRDHHGQAQPVMRSPATRPAGDRIGAPSAPVARAATTPTTEILSRLRPPPAPGRHI